MTKHRGTLTRVVLHPMNASLCTVTPSGTALPSINHRVCPCAPLVTAFRPERRLPSVPLHVALFSSSTIFQFKKTGIQVTTCFFFKNKTTLSFAEGCFFFFFLFFLGGGLFFSCLSSCWSCVYGGAFYYYYLNCTPRPSPVVVSALRRLCVWHTDERGLHQTRYCMCQAHG